MRGGALELELIRIRRGIKSKTRIRIMGRILTLISIRRFEVRSGKRLRISSGEVMYRFVPKLDHSGNMRSSHNNHHDPSWSVTDGIHHILIPLLQKRTHQRRHLVS